jgi:hypothetical protein
MRFGSIEIKSNMEASTIHTYGRTPFTLSRLSCLVFATAYYRNEVLFPFEPCSTTSRSDHGSMELEDYDRKTTTTAARQTVLFLGICFS